MKPLRVFEADLASIKDEALLCSYGYTCSSSSADESLMSENSDSGFLEAVDKANSSSKEGDSFDICIGF